MLKKITIPDKIIITGGLPRSGKTIIKNVLDAHSQVAHVPSGFNFFYWFSKDRYEQRGGFEENLEYFFQYCRKSKSWGLTREMVNYGGSSRKDLYLVILETYRAIYHPSKKYIAEYTHLSEIHLNTLIKWFGMDRLKFIQIIRNPYDNYASYAVARNVAIKDRVDRYDSLVNKFCNMWSQSATISMYNSLKYPMTFRTLFFEDITSNQKSTIKSLCKWIGIPEEVDNMLKKEYGAKLQNSTFLKQDVSGTSAITQDSYNRKQHLSNYEKNVIKMVSCPNMLTAMKYENQETIIDFKHISPEINLHQYESTMLVMIKSYISPLPPHKAIAVLWKVFINLFKLVISVGISFFKLLVSKVKLFY